MIVNYCYGTSRNLRPVLHPALVGRTHLGAQHHHPLHPRNQKSWQIQCLLTLRRPRSPTSAGARRLLECRWLRDILPLLVNGLRLRWVGALRPWKSEAHLACCTKTSVSILLRDTCLEVYWSWRRLRFTSCNVYCSFCSCISMAFCNQADEDFPTFRCKWTELDFMVAARILMEKNIWVYYIFRGFPPSSSNQLVQKKLWFRVPSPRRLGPRQFHYGNRGRESRTRKRISGTTWMIKRPCPMVFSRESLPNPLCGRQYHWSIL